MTIQEKLKYIQVNYPNEWLATRGKVANEISDSQLVICVCGKLATGLHEDYCGKLQNKIMNETLKRLKYLLGKGESKK